MQACHENSQVNIFLPQAQWRVTGVKVPSWMDGEKLQMVSEDSVWMNGLILVQQVSWDR